MIIYDRVLPTVAEAPDFGAAVRQIISPDDDHLYDVTQGATSPVGKQVTEGFMIDLSGSLGATDQQIEIIAASDRRLRTDQMLYVAYHSLAAITPMYEDRIIAKMPGRNRQLSQEIFALNAGFLARTAKDAGYLSLAAILFDGTQEDMTEIFIGAYTPSVLGDPEVIEQAIILASPDLKEALLDEPHLSGMYLANRTLQGELAKAIKVLPPISPN